MSESPTPWRSGLAAGLTSAAVLWLIVSIIDATAAGFGALPTLAGLWAPLALGVGVLVGVVAAGFRATFGDRSLHAALARLRDDRALDVAAIGWLLAGLVAALFFLVAVGIATKALVVGVQRTATGVSLLRLVVVALVPLCAFLAVPAYRVTRHVAKIVPRVGPVPGIVLLVVGGVIAVVGLGMLVLFTQLDWQVLGVGFYGLIALLFVGTILVHLVTASLRIPRRGVIGAAAAAVMLLVPALTIMGKPAKSTKQAVLDSSIAGSKLVGYYSKLFDHDGDGYSTFFDGPDCDDSDPQAYPGHGCRNGEKVAVHVAVKPEEGVDAGVAAPPTPGVKAVGDGMNLLIIMVDTVRADRIGASGYQRDGKSLTPNLDKLASESTYFTRAYSVASNTPRAMPAFMTSRYASQIKVDDLHANYPILDDSNNMLFESLKAAGFGTFGFSSHYYFQDKRHFNQGFDDYNNDGWLEVGPANHDISAPRIVPRVTDKLAELGQSKQRFAMWVHLFDPHSTYMEHDGFPPITEHGTEALKQKYDYEIAFEDQWIAKIFDQLAQSGLDKNTVVIMLADHGEAFGVHNFAGEQMFFHGQTLYDELLRIPLVIHVPGIAPSKFDQLVQLIDVAPTILDLFGVAIPSTFQGRSLLAALQGKPLPPKPAFAELISYPNWDHEARAMISADGKWKLFDRISDNLTELYDLENDPEERHDVFDQRQDIAKPMEDQLDDFVATTLSGGGQ